MLTLPEAREIVKECQLKLGINVPVTIQYNYRFTRLLGRATFNFVLRSGVIELSHPLFQRASRDDQINTVVHEYCHLASFFMYGNKKDKHGYIWETLHRRCGYEPRQYHNVDRTGLRRRNKKQDRYLVRCGCSTQLEVTQNLVTRMQKGRKYKCRRCQQLISCTF